MINKKRNNRSAYKNKYLTNDSINLLSYTNCQTECNHGFISTNKKDINITKRLARDNEIIRIVDEDKNNPIENPQPIQLQILIHIT